MSDVELTDVEIKIHVNVLYCIPFPKIGDGVLNDGLSNIVCNHLLSRQILIEFSTTLKKLKKINKQKR